MTTVLNLQQRVTAPTSEPLLTNINNATPTGSNIILSTDGSATFGAGNATIGTTGQISCNDVVASSTNDTFPVFRGLNAAGTATNFRVNGDGSATFAGDVAVDTGMIVGANAQPRVLINKSYGIVVRPISLAGGGAATDLLWTGYSNDNSTVTSKLQPTALPRLLERLQYLTELLMSILI